jgi:uncharacterized protein YbaR (Trm112 family)
MIRPDLLANLRCPLDPSHIRLEEGADGLVCQRCRLTYSIREGFPCLLPEEAKLPDGCTSLDDLPCQKEK